MDTDLQQTLLQLFQQVRDNPDDMPVISVDAWQEGSLEWQLLSGFQAVLERLQQSRQEAHKNAEQLREKEAEYRSIFEATDGVFIANLDGYPVEANPAVCKMFGYSYEEFIGLDPTTFIHPDSLHLQDEHVQASREDNEYQSQGVVLRKDGTSFLAEAHTAPFMYKGEPHILAMVHDITERVRAEEQVREKEAQYHSIFEATTDAVFIIDLEDGHVIEANPAACKVYGYSHEEFIGLPPHAIIHPDVLPNFLEKALPAIRAGGEYHTRGVNLRKDGSAFPIEVHETSFTYQGKQQMLVVLRDITQQVRAEEELREKEEQYRSIFEASVDGLLISDLEGEHIIEANPAICAMNGYTREELLALPPANLVHSESHSVIGEALQTIKQGGQFYNHSVALRKDGSTFEAESRGSIFMYKGKPHILTISRDITERMQVEEQLREKEAEYRRIFEATSDGLIIIDLESGRIVEANPAACEIYGYDYDEFIGSPATITSHPDDLPFIIENVIPMIMAGGDFRAQAVGLHKDGSAFHLDVHDTAFTYQGEPHVLAVVRDITEQVQAQQLLERRVEERTRELSTLLSVSHNVASTIELKPLLGLVLDQLKLVADYTGSSFSILEGDDLVLVDNRGPAPLEQALQIHLPVKRMGLIWEMFCRQEPVIIADVQDDTTLAQAFRTWMGNRMETPFSYIRAWMGVPLMLKEQVIGMLTLSSEEPDYYTPRHATLALAIANQAAVALENARLYEQAQELASLEERQRLARELHDSVSQALYGITLGTHTARTLLDRDPKQVVEPLNYVLSLAEAALAEMRALIFELRPESLETEGLVTSLIKQTTALQARHSITVSLSLCDEPDVPLKIKQELHRVAQEALHNIVKHAAAKKVDVQLASDTEGITLEIRDNGHGFDTTAAFPGHLGLHSMRERIGKLRGILHIESQPGVGTNIRARIPV